MADATGRSVLVIDGGDLPSLVACLIQPDAGRLVLWHVRRTGADGPRREDVVRQHAKLLETPLHVAASPELPDGNAPSDFDTDAVSALELAHAAAVARRLGAQRIIWPIQVGPHATKVAAAVDQATLVTELVHASAGESGTAASLMIDLPLIDLDETQIVDLADDAGAPPAFWPCFGGADEPCGVCGGCLRWLDAHERLGFQWPWTVSTAPRIA